MGLRPTKINQDAVNSRAGTAYSVPSGARGHCGLSPDRTSSPEHLRPNFNANAPLRSRLGVHLRSDSLDWPAFLEVAHFYVAHPSPMDLLPLRVPQVLVHGTDDEIVPFEMSERFVKASKNTRLVALRGAGHFEPIDPRSKQWPAVVKNILAPMFPSTSQNAMIELC